MGIEVTLNGGVMRQVSILALTVALVGGAAQAGGIDRGALGISALFDKGRVLTFGISSVSPNVAGVFNHPLAGPIPTGDMAEQYASLSLSFKDDINDKLAYAIFINQPYGADAFYQQGIYTGLEAHWSSTQIAGVLKYKVTDRISAYGGLRYVRSKAEINIPAQMLAGAGAYTASADSDGQIGYLVGAAYEIPDIALRASLTYQSEITHDFTTHERFANLNGGATLTGQTEITLPQSLAFDFQTGIAKDTLLFGGVKWSEWSSWHVRPGYYEGVVGDEVTGFSNDVITYQLGVGRRINENLSIFARVGYEAGDGEVASRLAPTDGMKSIGLGAIWTQDKMKITGGIEYVQLGDAVDASGTRFEGNKAVGVGIQVAYSF